MSALRDLLGLSRADLWHAVAAELGGVFHPGGWTSSDRIQAVSGDWILTLDRVTEGKVEYTRMQAPFVNRDGLRFTVYRAGLFTEIGKMLGMQDIEVLHPFFDQKYVVQGNNPHKIRALLQNHRIRAGIQAQQSVFFTIRPDEGAFLGPSYPEGVDQLLFLHQGDVRDLHALRALFDLFAETLHTLGHLDSAYRDDWQLHAETLAGPGGVIRRGDVILWDGDVARQRAAQALGRLGDRRAAGALAAVLRDASADVVASATWALGALGAVEAAPHVIVRLGDFRPTAGGPLCTVAAAALRQLGFPDIPPRFDAALAGQVDALDDVNAADRPWYVAGLMTALEAEHPPVVRHAAAALAHLGAAEALTAVRRAARRPQNRAIAGDLDAALQALQERGRLPRAAAPPAPDAAALPRPAEPAPTDGADLPRTSG